MPHHNTSSNYKAGYIYISIASRSKMKDKNTVILVFVIFVTSHFASVIAELLTVITPWLNPL